jgi:hypothetical protein
MVEVLLDMRVVGDESLATIWIVLLCMTASGWCHLNSSSTSSACMSSVADDSSLRQAKDVELKGKRARQDLQPSLTRRQVTRLQLKTIVERSTAVIPLFKVRCYGRLAVVSDVDDGGFALNVDKELRGSAVL